MTFLKTPPHRSEPGKSIGPQADSDRRMTSGTLPPGRGRFETIATKVANGTGQADAGSSVVVHGGTAACPGPAYRPVERYDVSERSEAAGSEGRFFGGENDWAESCGKLLNRHLADKTKSVGLPDEREHQ